MARVGLFGGTFDPIHVGHLDVIDAAIDALHLDRVLLVPANVPPHRSTPRASAPHRFAMAALAIVDRPACELSDLEMLSPEPSYTSTTLTRLEQRGVDTRHLFLITGADAFRDIESWKDYPALLDRCEYAVVSRPTTAAPTLRQLLPRLADRMVTPAERNAAAPRTSILLIDAPTAPVSSTEIRRRLSAGEDTSGMLPDLVRAHIEKHRLYKEASHAYGQI